MIFNQYFSEVEENRYIDTDVNTVTAGDYTIEFDLEESQFIKFQAHYYKKNNPMSEMAQFKMYIQDELEERINRCDDLGFDDS